MAAIPDCSAAPGLAYLFKWATDALDLRLESLSVDFKRSEPWESLKAKFVRHAMALGNQAGGGLILVGVAETDQGIELQGVDPAHLETYSRDAMLDWVNKYASPPLDLIAATVPYDGKVFLAVEVKEFVESPFICKKRGDKNVEVGDVFVRVMKGKPESTKLQSADDLRALLDRAAEKRAQRIIQGAHRAGFVPGRAADQEYRDEAAEFWKEPEVQTLRRSPCWEFVLRGRDFNEERITSLAECRRAVEGAVIHRGARRFPWASEERWTQGSKWASGFSRLQIWRIYQSAQFLFVGQVPEAVDYTCQSKLREDADKYYRSNIDWRDVPGFLLFESLLQQVVDFVEFASRLCRSGSYGSPVKFELTLANVKKFVLTVEDPFRINWSGDEHVVSDQRIGRVWEFDEAELVGGVEEVTLKITKWFLERFACSLSDQILSARLQNARRP